MSFIFKGFHDARVPEVQIWREKDSNLPCSTSSACLYLHQDIGKYKTVTYRIIQVSILHTVCSDLNYINTSPMETDGRLFNC